MSERNPFTVLGFSPDIFRGLDNDGIQNVIRHHVKVLSSLHHPDRGGGAARFKEIRDAAERLEEEFEFEFWKKQFLRSRKDILKEVETERRASKVDLGDVSDSLFRIWQAFAEGQQVVRWEALVGPLGERWYKNRIARFSVFDPPPLSMIVMDQIPGFLKLMEDAREKRRNTFFSDVGSTELCILNDGSCVVRNLERVSFDPKDVMPTVRHEWIELRSSTPNSSYYWRPVGDYSELPGRLIGSVPRKFLTGRPYPGEGPPPVAGLLNASGASGEADIEKVRSGFSPTDFAPYLKFITPQIIDGNYLIVTTRPPDVRYLPYGYARMILLSEDEHAK